VGCAVEPGGSGRRQASVSADSNDMRTDRLREHDERIDLDWRAYIPRGTSFPAKLSPRRSPTAPFLQSETPDTRKR
jgi:hypothetical protein